jgi:hypothetical protein
MPPGSPDIYNKEKEGAVYLGIAVFIAGILGVYYIVVGIGALIHEQIAKLRK